MSGTLVSLPSGGTCHLREPGQVPERLRRPVSRKLMVVTGAVDRYEHHDDGTVVLKSDEQIAGEMAKSGALDELTDASDLCAVAMISGWSLEVPVSVDALIDLPADDYEAIRSKTDPHLWSMTPKNFGVTTDTTSPTLPSGD